MTGSSPRSMKGGERRREVRDIADRYERWARTGSPGSPRWPEIATLLNEIVALDKELADLREVQRA